MPARDTGRLARWVGVALVLATLCNGLGIYLRKVGLVQTPAYHAYWAWHCSPVAHLQPHQRAQPGCCAHASTAELAEIGAPPRRDVEQALAQYIFELTPAEKALKLVKDVFVLAFVAVSAWLVAQRRPLGNGFGLGSSGQRLLLVYGCAMFGLSWAWHGLLMPVAGLRPLLFLAVFGLGAWMATHLPGLAKFVAVALALQLLLVPLELLAGIHINGHGHALRLGWVDFQLLLSRASGTLVLPNSLGVFAVTALAFCQAFAPSRRQLLYLTPLVLALIYFSGSGVGALAMSLFLLMLVLGQVPVHRRGWVAAGAAVLAAPLLVLLPELLGRPQIFDSVLAEGGRLETFKLTVLDKSALQLWFGQGLGVNTNIALNLQQTEQVDNAVAGAVASAPALRPTDSTLTALMVQLGAVGTGLFYALLFWAARKDATARPFYAVLALCSLTMNITEVFPVNFLLGLALAHSALRSKQDNKAHPHE